MIETDGERFRLAIPIEDAMAFALGSTNLGYPQPRAAARRVIGLFVLDALEYSEQWRDAALARAALARRWPDCPGFGPHDGG